MNSTEAVLPEVAMALGMPVYDEDWRIPNGRSRMG
jgi:hypothetical protein